MLKTIVLARVSDKRQDSNDAQLMRVLDYVKSKHLTIWQTVELKESSTRGDRKKFQEVIKEIKRSKEPIALVVDTIDRLQRSFRESVILDDFRKSGKLELHFYRENLVINKESNSADLLRWDMGVMFARSYVLQLSDNTKRRKQAMLQKGLWHQRAPFGYVSVHNTERKRINIIPEPQRAHLIQKMFSWYATGNYSLKTIRNRINAEGLTTAAGRPLAISKVDLILQNPFYCGEMPSKGKLYPHQYQPLVSKAIFQACKRVRQSRIKKPTKYAAKPYLFRGILQCATCGGFLTPETAKGQYVYYSCNKSRTGACSKRVYVPEPLLLEPVYHLLRALHNTPQSLIDQIVEDLRRMSRFKSEYHQQAIAGLQAEYNNLQLKVDRLIDVLLENPSFSKEDSERKLRELKDRQFEVTAKLEEHTRADEAYHVTAQTVLNLAKNALTIFEGNRSDPEQKHALLKYLLQNSMVDGKKLTFAVRKPFSTLLSLADRPSELRDLDEFRTLDWVEIRKDFEEFQPLELVAAA